MSYNNLAVACSGGIDSLAQTIITAKFAYENSRSFIALIIDHSVRVNSSQEAVELTELLSQYKISSKILPFVNLSLDNHNGYSSQNSCMNQKFGHSQLSLRKQRYKLLFDQAKKSNIQILQTAHQQNDQVENIIMRQEKFAPDYSKLIPKLSYQTTAKEREGSRPMVVFRPFLDQKKSILKKFLMINNIPWFEDPTNKNPQYTRNIVRKKLLETKNGYSYNQTVISPDDIENLKVTTRQYYSKLINFKKKHIIFDKYGNSLIKFSNSDYKSLKQAIKSAKQTTAKAENSTERIFELEAISEALATVSGHDYRSKYKKIFLAFEKLMLKSSVPSCSLSGCNIKCIDNNFYIYPEIRFVHDLRLGEVKTDQFEFDKRFIITRHLGYHPSSLLNDYKLTLANNVLSRKEIKNIYGYDLKKITWQTLPTLLDDKDNYLGIPIDVFDKKKLMAKYQISAKLKPSWRFMRKI